MDQTTAAEATRYAAFISYRHVEPDRTWARWLHRSLEAYRLPSSLVRDRSLPRRLGRIFRDEEELAASSDLSREIEAALQASDFLIVVCSPRVVASRWVNEEVERFRNLGRGDQVLALLTEGEPHESFPSALREIRPGMAKDDDATEEVEPLAADVRTATGRGGRVARRWAKLRLVATIVGCRFDDLRQRDQERVRQRALSAGAALLVLALVLVGLTAFAFQERNAKGRALDEVLRLAGSKKASDLLAEVDTLWPLHPARKDAMQTWLARADAVLDHRDDHAARRETLRRRGRLEEGVWSFSSDTDAWQHQVLTDLLAHLDALAGASASGEGAIARVRRRLDLVTNLRRRSIEDHEALWRETIDAIQDEERNPQYAGLTIRPQEGLVPLGSDPLSRLYEFAYLGSGTVPERVPGTNELEQEDDAAIVFVLIPAGGFPMGAQSGDPGEANYDADALPTEAPVRTVDVGPFFLARTECTQAQWAALTEGQRPSERQPGQTWGWHPITQRNPVEQVSWNDARRWLARHGLTLPSEVQWEYACRAGTSDPWFTGETADTLGTHPSEASANIADRHCKEHGGPMDWVYTLVCDDGHTVHAPVASFYANDFGLYDMHGNVWEWCADDLTAGEGRESECVVRGGSWADSAAYARSAYRGVHPPTFRSGDLGFRPARELTR